jgi:hypothetical protein
MVGRLIENEDLRTVEEGARDRQALALAPREAYAALPDGCLIAERKLGDHVIGGRAADGLRHRFR